MRDSKLCINCDYYKHSKFTGGAHMCTVHRYTDPVTGEEIPKQTYCNEERGYIHTVSVLLGKCGVRGRFFKAKA